MTNNLEVSNIVLSGKMPFKHKLNHEEISRLIEESKLGWMIINEEISPIIRRFKPKKELTKRGKQKNAHISIWTSGAIIITGVTSMEEGKELYEETIRDLENFCRRVFE